LKYHGGADLKELKEENVEALKNGTPNLEKHIENVKKYGITPIIAINRFITDTEEEIDALLTFAKDRKIKIAVADVWAEGGKGALELAQLVVDLIDGEGSDFKPLYNWKSPVEEKIAKIAKEIYGAKTVEYSTKAQADLKRIYNLGLDALPICMAKTEKSLSDDPKLLGRPSDFSVTVREIEIAAGAGFIIPITGNIMRMPGLPAHPAAEQIDVNEEGKITGLF
jgi:formate--tetrahydrofolate ligase